LVIVECALHIQSVQEAIPVSDKQLSHLCDVVNHLLNQAKAKAADVMSSTLVLPASASKLLITLSKQPHQHLYLRGNNRKRFHLQQYMRFVKYLSHLGS
jgi:hypothetical protein